MVSEIEECWPLQDWRWLDVWSYIVSNELPYLWLYDKRAELVGYEHARFTTLFDSEFAVLGADSIDNVAHWRWRNEP
jgi:3'-phosphoadenosine 5'-phosphosulfate sulfotransferase (PAPS reductase)/FAD synthetase